MAFLGILIYCAFQTFLSARLSFALYSNTLILWARIVLMIIALVVLLLSNKKKLKIEYFELALVMINYFLILALVFNIVARSLFRGTNDLKWSPGDGGFTEHIISSSCEWAFVFFIIVILTTFVIDYNRIRTLNVTFYYDNN